MIEPVRLLPARGEPLPLIVEIPHAGVHVDAETLGHSVAPLWSVGRDADLYVDRIFAEAPSLGASLLSTPFSRFVLDLNRAKDDYDGVAVEGGGETPRPRGLVWRTTTDGDPILARRLSQEELDRRLNVLYEPYHAAIVRLLAERRAQFDHVLLLCAHSMPSVGRRGHIDLGEGRADIVPGTRGGSSAHPELISAVERACEAHGLSFRHDDPYRGGFSTGHYGSPERGISAIQIEVARRLYMDETTLILDPEGLIRMKNFAATLIQEFRDALSNMSPDRP